MENLLYLNMCKHDNLIDRLFFKNNVYYLSNVVKFNKLKRHKYTNIYDYIINRFDDSYSNRETIYRIHYHIEHKPTCPVCGKKLLFHGRNNKLFLSHCSNKCKKLDNDVNQKWKTSCGDLGTNRAKSKTTIKEKYGVENPYQIPEVIEHIKQINIAKKEQTQIKVQETSLIKYGTNYPNQSNIVKQKIIQSSLEKYGVEHPIQSQAVKNKYNWDIITDKITASKRKNHTFNTSIPETESYNLLSKKYSEVQYQYKSEVYPFVCDFYIPTIDTYIECNYHWTHGGKPYEGTDEDNLLLEKWKSKNSKYYNNAIKTWTVRDVNKQNIAKENNLNYFVFYSIEELKNWINS